MGVGRAALTDGKERVMKTDFHLKEYFSTVNSESLTTAGMVLAITAVLIILLSL